MYCYFLLQDLFLSVGVDKTNDTILYSHDSSAKPDDRPLDITFRVQEGIGSVLSLKMIDMEVLQPPFPGKYTFLEFSSLKSNLTEARKF